MICVESVLQCTPTNKVSGSLVPAQRAALSKCSVALPVPSHQRHMSFTLNHTDVANIHFPRLQLSFAYMVNE
jgi:hypothetical protein